MATLHLLVGLPCSGKAKKAKNLERIHNALLISPDEWIKKLFGNNAESKDLIKNRDAIESIMWSHASRILKLGVNVILDYDYLPEAEAERLRLKAKDLGADIKIHNME